MMMNDKRTVPLSVGCGLFPFLGRYVKSDSGSAIMCIFFVVSYGRLDEAEQIWRPFRLPCGIGWQYMLRSSGRSYRRKISRKTKEPSLCLTFV